MPKRYHLPDSSQLDSHLRATRPARKAKTAPSRPATVAACRSSGVPAAAAACDGLEQAHGFACDGRRGEHDGEREGESLSRIPRDAREHAGRNRRARAGEAAEGNAQALDDADHARLPERDGFGGEAAAVQRFGRAPAHHAAAFGQARDEDEDAGAEQGRGDQVQTAEELLDLRFTQPVRHLLFDDVDDGVADQRRQHRGDHDADDNGDKRFARAKVSNSPAAPEIGDHGEHGAGVQHDQKERHFGRGGIQAHQFFGDDDMGGARDGQELGESLHDGEDEVFQNGHRESLVQRWVGWREKARKVGCCQWTLPTITFAFR